MRAPKRPCLSPDKSQLNNQETLRQLVAKLFTLVHLDGSSEELGDLVGALP